MIYLAVGSAALTLVALFAVGLAALAAGRPHAGTLFCVAALAGTAFLFRPGPVKEDSDAS